MVKLYDKGIYLLNGTEIIEDTQDVQAILASKGASCTQEEAAANTMAYGILKEHNTSGNMKQLRSRNSSEAQS